MSIDAEIARAQGKLAQWEEVGKNTRTERQNVNREECGVIRRMTLGNLIQEKREVVDTTMDLIKFAIKGAIERTDRRSPYCKYNSDVDKKFSFETKRQPFNKEAIEKFGTGIIFPYPFKDISIKGLMISKLETSHYFGTRNKKRHNFVIVYFREVDFR